MASTEQLKKYFDEFNELAVDEKHLTQVDISGQLQIKKRACTKHVTQTHLTNFFTRVGFLDILQESYLERICLCRESAQGTSDIFIGIDINNLNKSTGTHVRNPMPLSKHSYTSCKITDIYEQILKRCALSEKSV